MNIEFEYQDLKRLERRLLSEGRRTGPMMRRIHTRVGARVLDRAKRYAPKSPTDQERRSVSRATKAQWSAAKKRRSATATSRTKPGALQNSIQLRATHLLAEIFVPTNSPAGAYAWKMHEEKGKTWHNRGIGTVKKGEKADEKFIERAINDSEQELVAIIQDETEKIRRSLS